MNTRRILLPLILLLALGAASSASAGGSIFAGANFPTGDFSNDTKTGWTLGGYFTGNLTPIFDVGGLLAYNDFSTDLSQYPELDEALDGSIDIWELHGLAQINFLFLKGFLGLGFANYQTANEAFESERKTDFSWQLGLAMDFLMLEGRLGYHHIPVDDGSLNWVALTVGLKF